MREISPTARALKALEAIQNTPGITAERLGQRLGVTERAARRYVAILREADIPIESVTGPHGGYQVGRGLRLPPLMLTAAEAMGLVMAVLEGHKGAADSGDLVGGGLAKILRLLPRRVVGPIRTIEQATGTPSPVRHEIVAELIEACSAARRLRIGYGRADGTVRTMEVDPWAVVLRHSRWYLLAWSHTRDARRVLRADRITTIERTPQTFTPPEDLDASRMLEEHLFQDWAYPVEVVLDAPLADVARWTPRSLGRLEPTTEEGRTRLVATTENAEWYARQLAALPMPFEVVGGAELRKAVIALGERLAASGRAESPLR